MGAGPGRELVECKAQECERRGYAARGLAPARRGGDGTLKAEAGPGRKGAGPASVEAGLRG